MPVKFGLQSLSVAMLMEERHRDTQLRVKINSARLQQYAEEMKEGCEFPPPVVFFDTKEQCYFIGDGFHRIGAYELNGKKSVVCEVRRGTKLDAILLCLEINFHQQRGLNVTYGDKTKAVTVLLEDPVAGQWSKARIAKEVGCTAQTVDYVIKSRNVERPETVLDVNERPIPSSQRHPEPQESKERRRVIKEKKLQGLTEKEIAEDTGLPIESVRYHGAQAMLEPDVIDCPHCHGTGKIRINAEAN